MEKASNTPLPRPYPFGVSEFTTWPWSFEQDVDQYGAIGVDAIEVCEFKLAGLHPGEVARVIGERSMAVGSVQPAVRTLFPSLSQPEPKSPRDRMERFQRTIERLALLGDNVPFVTNTGRPPSGNIEELLQVAASEYRRAADFAARHGARIAFEPLNPTIMNVESAIWTVEQAIELIERVDRESFGLCLDYWNVWQNADVEAWIRQAGSRIFVVQVSDWRTPRSFQDRRIPGDGAIPLAALMQATRESGYTGPYSVEIFSGDVPDSLWKSDLRGVLESSRRGMDRAWFDAEQLSSVP